MIYTVEQEALRVLRYMVYHRLVKLPDTGVSDALRVSVSGTFAVEPQGFELAVTTDVHGAASRKRIAKRVAAIMAEEVEALSKAESELGK